MSMIFGHSAAYKKLTKKEKSAICQPGSVLVRAGVGARLAGLTLAAFKAKARVHSRDGRGKALYCASNSIMLGRHGRRPPTEKEVDHILFSGSSEANMKRDWIES
jgi:hypothetical protein